MTPSFNLSFFRTCPSFALVLLPERHRNRQLDLLFRWLALPRCAPLFFCVSRHVLVPPPLPRTFSRDRRPTHCCCLTRTPIIRRPFHLPPSLPLSLSAPRWPSRRRSSARSASARQACTTTRSCRRSPYIRWLQRGTRRWHAACCWRTADMSARVRRRSAVVARLCFQTRRAIRNKQRSVTLTA